MTGRLPAGLINIVTPEVHTPTPPRSAPGGNDQIPVDEVARAWKVYATASRVTQEATGVRLQNLFWRLWSNPYLIKVISSATVTELVYRFGQGYGRIQLPPRRARILPPSAHPRDETISDSSPGQHPTRPLPETGTATGDDADTTPAVDLSPTPSPLPPQSILKKTRSESDPRRKSVTVEVPSSGLETVGHGSDVSGSQAETSSSTSPRPPVARTSSGNKKRTGLMAKSKTRPSLGRRRSSDKPKGPKSPLKQSHGNIALGDAASDGGLRPGGVGPIPPLPTLKPPAGFTLPSASSWQSVDSEPGPLQSRNPQAQAPQASSVLVDPNFRDKFVENQRRIASFTNLAATGRLGKSGSVVRFADEIPDLIKGKERATSPSLLRGSGGRSSESLAQDKPQRKGSGDSQVFEDDDEDDDEEDSEKEALPRTKSQLSVLIESRRRQSGTRDLGPPSGSNRQERKTKEKAPGDGPGEEEKDELIMMARREGVTRAGGVAPGRSTHRISGGSQHRYRSPTPPPLYG